MNKLTHTEPIRALQQLEEQVGIINERVTATEKIPFPFICIQSMSSLTAHIKEEEVDEKLLYSCQQHKNTNLIV